MTDLQPSANKATTSGPLTPERIIEAAEETLRRFGPAKTTVVDVARALGVSHGSVYRHFPNKAALRDAVVNEWLGRSHARLAAIAAEDAPAPERLERLVRALAEWKQSQAQNDPDLFSAYAVLTGEASDPTAAHVQFVEDRLTDVVVDGVRRGEIVLGAGVEPAATARAVFHATALFHGPANRDFWSRPSLDEAFGDVWRLVLNGLLPRG